MPHPDLAAERAHLNAAHDALEAMAGRTQRVLTDDVAAATAADSEVATFHLRRRLASLASADESVAFGRIDEGRDRWYIGRRHVEDDAGDPLVVDWRAPVSVPFYRATVHDPLGLDRRRRFLTEGRELVDILEEDFNDPEGSALSGGIPDPLLAELERERTGAMRDIVATIAAEQDEIIRAPLDRLLVVQGGPGTGKTAVALHRAAYLLFEHRLTLLDRGVLVVGPNAVFLRYVADVLPSLGETAVRQTTIESLRSPRLRLDDTVDEGAGAAAEAAALRGDHRMAAVVDAAVRTSIRVPAEPLSVSTAWGTVRFEPDRVAAAVEDILDRGVTHAAGRESLRNQLLHGAYEIHEQVAEVPALKSNYVAAARRDPGVRAALDKIWPTLSAPTLIHGLVASAAKRRRATRGILDEAEATVLAREVPKKVGDVRWLASEIPLLDEAEARLTGPRVTYGHVIVDEAQDLTDMALRMLARRADDGSLTVVGDLAQATRPGAQRRWERVVEVLAGQGRDVDAQLAELTVGYRTPAPILDLANRLLPEAAPDVTPARSIRATGVAPRLVRTGDVVGTAATTVAGLRADDDRGTVAVVAVATAHGDLSAALDAAGVEWAPGAGGLGSIALLTPLLAKGLEFDHVVCVEPAAIVRDEPTGARALFVALTRATTTLTIVHAEALPAALQDGPSAGAQASSIASTIRSTWSE